MMADDLLTTLRSLGKLPKVHYSWPLPKDMLTPGNETLAEYARITQAVTVDGYWLNRSLVEAAMLACKATGASLAIAYSPWIRVFQGNDPLKINHEHVGELTAFWDRLFAIRQWLGELNDQHSAAVSVSAVVLDAERFRVSTDQNRNDAITLKHDCFYCIGKSLFPAAQVIWYDFGAIKPGPSDTGWGRAPYHTVETLHDSYSVSLYRLYDRGTTREMFRRTVKTAEAGLCDRVIPWVALASGYRLQPDGKETFDFDYQYDPIESWQLGREINIAWFGDRPKRFAPWHAADCVVFWPAPFDARSPHWAEHFTAYVLGATGLKRITAEPIDDEPAGG